MLTRRDCFLPYPFPMQKAQSTDHSMITWTDLAMCLLCCCRTGDFKLTWLVLLETVSAYLYPCISLEPPDSQVSIPDAPAEFPYS